MIFIAARIMKQHTGTARDTSLTVDNNPPPIIITQRKTFVAIRYNPSCIKPATIQNRVPKKMNAPAPKLLENHATIKLIAAIPTNKMPIAS